MSASMPSQPPVAMSPAPPPPTPPPPQLAVLSRSTVVRRTASLDAAIVLWLQKSIERVIPLAKALRVSPGAAPAPPGGGSDEGIAAAFVAQAVLGVPTLHDLINATPPPSATKIAMTPDLVTVPLASTPLDDAGYVAGGRCSWDRCDLGAAVHHGCWPPNNAAECGKS
jgi:hypothetical protein